jgi:integrase/recombinase XerC
MDDFETRLRINGYAHNTIMAYTATIRMFLASHDPATVTPEMAHAFIYAQPPASRRRHWAALRAYYRKSERNPVADIPIPPAVIPQVRVPTFGEAVAIIESTTDPRNRLILELLYGSGFRVGALLSIRISDIDFTNQWIILHDKGSREHVMPFGANSMKWLRYYLADMRCPSGLLFPGLTARSVRRIIANASSKAGLPPIGPHSFRHAFAAHIRRNGADVVELKNLMGHNRIESTERYLAITPVTLSESRKKHPRK